MSNQHKKVIDALNHLLSRNIDSQKGYVEVANNLSSTRLTEWMIQYSRQREGFVRELRNQISALGGEPAESGTFLGEMHRAWVDMKANFTDDNTEELLEECIRGEEKALEDYEEVLREESLNSVVRGLLQGHTAHIRTALQGLRKMEEFYDNVDS